MRSSDRVAAVRKAVRLGNRPRTERGDTGLNGEEPKFSDTVFNMRGMERAAKIRKTEGSWALCPILPVSTGGGGEATEEALDHELREELEEEWFDDTVRTTRFHLPYLSDCSYSDTDSASDSDSDSDQDWD